MLDRKHWDICQSCDALLRYLSSALSGVTEVTKYCVVLSAVFYNHNILFHRNPSEVIYSHFC